MRKLITSVALCAFAFANGAYAAGLAPESFNKMYSLAHSGDIYGLREAIHRGLYIDSPNQNGNTGLCVAIYRGDQRAYNTFRAAGANPRHPCTSVIPAAQYNSFMSSGAVVASPNTVPALTYTPIHTGFLYSPRFWTYVGLGAIAIAALAFSGGGGGHKKSSPEPEPEKVDEGLAKLSGTYVVTNRTDEETGEKLPDEDLITTNVSGKDSSKYTITSDDGFSYKDEYADYFSQKNNYRALTNPLQQADRFLVSYKFSDGVLVKTSGQALGFVNLGEIGLAVYGWGKDGVLTKYDASSSFSVESTNAAYGIVAGNLATATLGGMGTIDVQADGDYYWSSAVGMYADTGALIRNKGTINGSSNGDGTAVGMMTMQVIDHHLKKKPSGYGEVITRAVNDGTITMEGKNIVAMGGYMAEPVKGSRSKFDKATLVNNNKINIKSTGTKNELIGDKNTEEASGYRGAVGMRADAVTTATNMGQIALSGGSSSDSGGSGSGDSKEGNMAGMMVVHGGTIINGYKDYISGKGSDFDPKGIIIVGGTDGIIDDRGNIDIKKIDPTPGYGMVSLAGGLLLKNNPVNNLINYGQIYVLSDGSSAIYVNHYSNVAMGNGSYIYLNRTGTEGKGQTVIENASDREISGTSSGDKIETRGKIEIINTPKKERSDNNPTLTKDVESYVFKGLFKHVYNYADIVFGDPNFMSESITRSEAIFLYDYDNFSGVLHNYGAIEWNSALSAYNETTREGYTNHYLLNGKNYYQETNGAEAGSLTVNTLLLYAKPTSTSAPEILPIESILYVDGSDVGNTYSIVGKIEYTNNDTKYTKNEGSEEEPDYPYDYGGHPVLIEAEDLDKLTSSADLILHQVAKNTKDPHISAGDDGDQIIAAIKATDVDNIISSSNIEVTDASTISSHHVHGIYAINTDNYSDMIIENSGNITVVPTSSANTEHAAIRAIAGNESAIKTLYINNSGTLISPIGIFATAIKNNSNVSIENSGTIENATSGIYIYKPKGVDVSNSGIITFTLNAGIYVYQATDKVSIENSGNISSESSFATAIHTKTTSDIIDIVNMGTISSKYRGIWSEGSSENVFIYNGTSDNKNASIRGVESAIHSPGSSITTYIENYGTISATNKTVRLGGSAIVENYGKIASTGNGSAFSLESSSNSAEVTIINGDSNNICTSGDDCAKIYVNNDDGRSENDGDGIRADAFRGKLLIENYSIINNVDNYVIKINKKEQSGEANQGDITLNNYGLIDGRVYIYHYSDDTSDFTFLNSGGIFTQKINLVSYNTDIDITNENGGNIQSELNVNTEQNIIVKNNDATAYRYVLYSPKNIILSNTGEIDFVGLHNQYGYSIAENSGTIKTIQTYKSKGISITNGIKNDSSEYQICLTGDEPGCSAHIQNITNDSGVLEYDITNYGLINKIYSPAKEGHITNYGRIGYGDPRYAIYHSGDGDFDITNNGKIIGSQYGIYVRYNDGSGSPSLFSRGTINITNAENAEITSSSDSSSAVYVYRTGNINISNSGRIIGQDYGLYLDSYYQIDILNNENALISGNTGIYANAGTEEDINLYNRGEIGNADTETGLYLRADGDNTIVNGNGAEDDYPTEGVDAKIYGTETGVDADWLTLYNAASIGDETNRPNYGVKAQYELDVYNIKGKYDAGYPVFSGYSTLPELKYFTGDGKIYGKTAAIYDDNIGYNNNTIFNSGLIDGIEKGIWLQKDSEGGSIEINNSGTITGGEVAINIVGVDNVNISNNSTGVISGYYDGTDYSPAINVSGDIAGLISITNSGVINGDINITSDFNIDSPLGSSGVPAEITVTNNNSTSPVNLVYSGTFNINTHHAAAMNVLGNVEAHNAGTINVGSSSQSVYNAHGMYAGNGARIYNDSDAVINVYANTNGVEPSGLSVGDNSYGENAGTINVYNSGNFSGIWAGAENAEAVNNGTINVNGQYNRGITAVGGGSTATNSITGTINVNVGYGMYATEGAKADNYRTINISGTNSYGMYATEGSKANNYGDINITGNASGIHAKGMAAENNATAVNYGTIDVVDHFNHVSDVLKSVEIANTSYGMYATNNGTIINAGTITVGNSAGDGYAIGMLANGTGSQAINYGSIYVKSDGIAMLTNGGANITNNGYIEISNNNFSNDHGYAFSKFNHLDSGNVINNGVINIAHNRGYFYVSLDNNSSGVGGATLGTIYSVDDPGNNVPNDSYTHRAADSLEINSGKIAGLEKAYDDTTFNLNKTNIKLKLCLLDPGNTRCASSPSGAPAANTMSLGAGKKMMLSSPKSLSAPQPAISSDDEDNTLVVDNTEDNPIAATDNDTSDTPAPATLGKSAKVVSLSGGSTFVNNGLVISDEDIDFDEWTEDDESSVQVSRSGTFAARSLKGTVVATADIVTSETNENEYETEGSFIGDTEELTVESGSYLFSASLANTGGAVAGIRMTMKDFEDVKGAKGAADFLDENYNNGNRVDMFNRIKAASNQAAYEKVVNEELGLDFIPTLAKQNIEFVRDTSGQMTDSIFENIDSATRREFITGIDYYHHRNSSYEGVMSYDSDGMNVYGVYDEDLTADTSVGLGFAIGTNRSEYDDDSTARQTTAQVYVPVSFAPKEFSFVSMPRFGAGVGKYKRRVADDSTHQADLTTYYYGISNQARKKFEFGGIDVEPTAEFNVLGMYMDKIKERDNLYVKSQNDVSVEGGLGLYIGKTVEFANSAVFKLRLGGTYYHELADPYRNTKAGFVDADGTYEIKGYNAKHDRGVVSLKADYNFALFDLYIKASEYIESNTNFAIQAGMKYSF